MDSKIIVDVFMLTNTKNREYFDITRDAVLSLKASETLNFRFKVYLIESSIGSNFIDDYTGLGCEVILFNDRFSFSKVINYALRHTKNKYVLLTNNDVIFDKNWFVELYKYTNLKDVAVWSTYDPNLNFQHSSTTEVIEGYKPCGIHSGWCYLIDVDKIRDQKFLSEEFDVWFMDDDFCMNLQNHGFRQILCKKSIVYHLNGKSNNIISDFTHRTNQDRIKFTNKYKDQIRIHNIQFIDDSTVINFESIGTGGEYSFLITGDVYYEVNMNLVEGVYYFISVGKSKNIDLTVTKNDDIIFRKTFYKIEQKFESKNFDVSRDSLELVRKISEEIENKTFHHHYHILYDIANSYEPQHKLTYLEIGCFAGGSACLMLQRPNTDVISIDLSDPIPQEVVMSNVDKMNPNKNRYVYIKGDSHDQSTLVELDRVLNGRKIDILFIDGDHSYNGVKLDFELYNKYLNETGYIVFDDYNDIDYSPEVKMAVDNLDLSDFDIIGQFGAEFGARPIGLNSNEFVIRKRTKSESIAIVIPTYYRPDGQTKYLLERALVSLQKQTDKNFKVFIIGDKYENVEELNLLSKLLEDTFLENLSYAKEREKYSGYNLWCSGGVNAMNVGIDKALSDGYNWIITMDHDDYFEPNHIEEIRKFINYDNSVFVCSKARIQNDKILPIIDSILFKPYPESQIKSSACVNYSVINLRYRDVLEDSGVAYPADADLFDRLNKLISKNKYNSYCTNKVTCVHDQEGYSKLL